MGRKYRSFLTPTKQPMTISAAKAPAAAIARIARISGSFACVTASTVLPCIARALARRDHYGEDTDAADQAVPVAYGEDDRVVIDGPAMRKNDDAAEPVQQNRAYQPKEFRPPVKALDGEGRNIQREDRNRVQAACGRECADDGQIHQAIVTARRIRQFPVNAHRQFDIT